MHMLTSLFAKGRSRSALVQLVCLGVMVLWSTAASAAVSPYCSTQSLTVASGGSVTSANLSTCDGPSDIGMAPVAPNGNPFNTAHGTVTLNPGIIGGNQFAVYVHNGDAATSDTFQLEDENGDTLTFNVTITPPAMALGSHAVRVLIAPKGSDNSQMNSVESAE